MEYILDFLDRLEEEIGYGCRIAIGKHPENSDILCFRIDWPNKIMAQFFIPRQEIRQMASENAIDDVLISSAITAYKSNL